MFGERRGAGEELLEGRRVLLVLELLRLVAGVEVVLKLTTEVNLLEGVAGLLRTFMLIAELVNVCRLVALESFRRWRRLDRLRLARAVGRGEVAVEGFGRGGLDLRRVVGPAGELVEYLFLYLALLVLRLHLFEDGVFE